MKDTLKRTAVDAVAVLSVIVLLWLGYIAYVTTVRVNALWAWAQEANPRVFPDRVPRPPQPAPEPPKAPEGPRKP